MSPITHKNNAIHKYIFYEKLIQCMYLFIFFNHLQFLELILFPMHYIIFKQYE